MISLTWDLTPTYVDYKTFLQQVQDGDVWYMESSLPQAQSAGLDHKLIYFWRIASKDMDKIEYFGFARSEGSEDSLPLYEPEFSNWLKWKLTDGLPEGQTHPVSLLLTLVYNMKRCRKLRRINLEGLHT